MKAVIMAGGFGTRLRPLTSNIPKPMVPLVNVPMMEHIVNLLKHHGIRNIVTTLFYQPETIVNYFGDGGRFGVNIQYRKAEADLGTAGSVRNARDFLDERFIVISGDVLTDFDLTSAIRYHNEKRAKATLLLTHHESPLQFGVVLTKDDGKISRFLEKPSWGEVFSDTINTGIYILEPELLDLIPRSEEFDFSKNLFPMMLEQDMGVYGHIASGYWRDIGNLHEYQDAHFDIFRGGLNIQFNGKRERNLVIGEGSFIETQSENISGMIVIGKGVKIYKDVVIADSAIGDDCEILPGAIIRNSIIWKGTKIGSRAILSSDVIGTKCVIGDEAIISENVFISDECQIGRKSQIQANVKLWPEKTVEDKAVVTRSLVWEDRWFRELFTNARISGVSNIEINPEFAAKLGASYGAFLGTGTSVVSSRDVDNVSRMINRALMCGLMSAGVNCSDLRAASIPIVRHELRSGKAQGGFHVRKSPYNKNYTDIIFFDSDGKDIPLNKTKAVERLFFGEDFRRASYESVGSISFPERTAESYVAKLLATLKIQAIRSANLKLVIDYSNGVASTIFPNVLGDLNVTAVSLNAYLDKTKLTRSHDEVQTSLRELAYVVTALKYDIGCMVDSGAEKVLAVDENGNIIGTDRMLTLMTKLFLLANPEVRKVAVPVSATGEIDMLASKMKFTVVRTRDSHLALMEAASNKEIKFVGGTRGGFIFNDFLFAVDGIYGVAKLLELMAITKKRLGELDAETPRLHSYQKSIQCPWNAKAKVMRLLMKDSERLPRELIDGVKLYFPKRSAFTSVFLSPDRTHPKFNITAESEDVSISQQLAEEYEQKLINWVKD